ncbi:ABC-type transporter, periplasmic subunit [Salmonella enterica subsp. arizonae]|uniref:ABC-type transporter, periplasmic subunit n=1 Tax=Salmonella enterica subsp. arizonae TaxID=59203 RepID=A0A379SVX5_SALER|nr:ABC-type transporter, periplasmic subunit [Salmonella enterica subsp. arizonae]
MLQPLGIVVSLQSGSWETVERHMHANPTLFGWGSLDPMETLSSLQWESRWRGIL